MSPAKSTPSGLKCVLLVAPEDSTRLAAKWALTDFGYLVDVARSAEEALTIFEPAIHDVVVTADTTPGITGAELAHIVKLRSPRTPVVLLAERAAPPDRACLDAVLEKGGGVWGLTAVLQKLLGGAAKHGNLALRKSRSEARRLRKLVPAAVPEGQAESGTTV